MARYRTYEERKKIQRLWETGATAKEIAGEISASVSSIYAELRRGKTKNAYRISGYTTTQTWPSVDCKRQSSVEETGEHTDQKNRHS